MKTIILYCCDNPFPSSNWDTTLTIKQEGDRIDFWAELGPIYRSTDGEPELVGTVYKGSDWREIVSQILNMGNGHLGGDFRNAIELNVKGDDTFRGELYLLAWMDDSCENGITLHDIVRFLLKLDDEQLETFHSQIGSFLADDFIDRTREILEVEVEYADEHREFPQLHGIDFSEHEAFAKYVKAVRDWKSAIDEEEGKVRAERQRQLKPFKEKIDKLCARHSQKLANSGGFGGAHGSLILHSHFLRFVEDYVLEHGDVPDGEVGIDRIGSLRIMDKPNT